MKVGTDGVLLGAWVDVAGAERILDVGTGTGLIALMLAQRGSARIDAVEIDGAAAQQAQENIEQSPWADRVQVYPTALQSYAAHCSDRYDVVVSNPPFFENDLPAANTARTLARHNDRLSPRDLVQSATRLLSEQGRLAVIYPVDTAHQVLQIAADYGLTCRRQLAIKPKAHLPVKRIALELCRDAKLEPETTLVIEEPARHVYTPEFIALIKDFYLKY
ncbi:MAG: methyltransferase [Anaerolineae bacterium]|nr:methyltransferase [Anaerolineae bacterium]